MPDKYTGKIIKSKDGLKGKCIGCLPKTKEVVIQHDKGGRIAYIKEGNIDNAR